MKNNMKKMLMVFIVTLFLAGCGTKAIISTSEPTVFPTNTQAPSSTPTLTLVPATATATLTASATATATVTPIPSNTATAVFTSTPVPSRKYHRPTNPTPVGVQCDIEPQWNQQPTPDHMKQYGCFAFSCGGLDGWRDGNNYYCVFDDYGLYSTPWPYDWVPYHPLMDNLTRPSDQ